MIQTTSAVFFTGEVLKPQILTKDDVTVVILGDVHVDTSLNQTKTKEQLADLSKIAKKYKPFFIFEDPLTYAGNEAQILEEILKIRLLRETKNKKDVLLDLNKTCFKKNMRYISAECRYALFLEKSLKEQIIEIVKTINILLACNASASYQNYLKETLNHSLNIMTEFIKDPKNKDEELIKIHLEQVYFDLLNINVVCEFTKAFNTKKYKLFVIGVGAEHLQYISEILKKVFKFKTIMQKNLIRTLRMRSLINLGSEDKRKQIDNKFIDVSNDLALDLPQFFQEALKAQPIRSRL